MFYKQNKTFWYQFCNFKHFLKAENSEDSLASSCAAQVIGLTCTSLSERYYWTYPTPTKQYRGLAASAMRKIKR